MSVTEKEKEYKRKRKLERIKREDNGEKEKVSIVSLCADCNGGMLRRSSMSFRECMRKPRK